MAPVSKHLWIRLGYVFPAIKALLKHAQFFLYQIVGKINIICNAALQGTIKDESISKSIVIKYHIRRERPT